MRFDKEKNAMKYVMKFPHQGHLLTKSNKTENNLSQRELYTVLLM